MIGRLCCRIFGHLPSVLVREQEWSVPVVGGQVVTIHTRVLLCPRCRRVWRINWVDHE